MMGNLIFAGFEKNVLKTALRFRYEISDKNSIDLFPYHEL